MISSRTIAELHCPYCGSALTAEREGGDDVIVSGVASCACYRYPVLNGILILRQLSGLADNKDPIVERLDAGDRVGALNVAMGRLSAVPPPRPLQHRALDALVRRAPAGLGRALSSTAERLSSGRAVEALESSPSFQDATYRLRPPGFAEYLYSRHSNPSYLSALAMLLALSDQAPSGRLLDLACGTGHSTFALATLFPTSTLFAADHDFINLCLVQRFQAPDAICICLDAELPLPFADDWFQTAFCLDSFHYIRSKVALVRELERVIVPDGLWMFPHLHNANRHNINAGVALNGEGYARLFGAVAPRLFDENQILKQFVETDAVDLAGAEPAADPPTLTLVADRRGHAYRNHENLAGRLLRKPERLGINPMYEVVEQGAKLVLKLRVLSKDLADECALGLNHLEPELELPFQLLDRLPSGRLSEADLDLARKLIRGFVLVPLPERYSATQRPRDSR